MKNSLFENSALKENPVIICYILLFIALTISVLNILNTLPNEDEYYYRADEGIYYRQGTIIKQQGLSGFRTLGNNYLTTVEEQTGPPPLRLAQITIAALFLSTNSSITSLSNYSLISYIILNIILFIFIKKYWGVEVGLIAVIMMIFSPLNMGLARRALMDPTYYLFTTLSLFLLINFVEVKSRRNFLLLLASLVFNVLLKETCYFLMPFFIITLLVLKFTGDKEIKLLQIAAIAILPPAVAGTLYLIAFGGFTPVLEICKILVTPNFNTPMQYIVDFGSGPWYQYFIDYFVMSPIISLLFFLYLGHYLTSSNKNIATNIIISFFIYFIICFAPLPKNIRYGVNLNFIYILFAALMLINLFDRLFTNDKLKKIALGAIVLLISLLGLKTYNKFFIDYKIYDPIAFNLLSVERIIPITYNAADNSNARINKAARQVLEEPTLESFLELSQSYAQAGLYNKALATGFRVVELKPDSDAGFNNLSSIYNALKQWDKAIEAANKALQINPNLAAAKNNLAIAEKGKNSAQ